MTYQDFVKQGLLKKEEMGPDQINKVIAKASRNLKSARILIKNNDEQGAFRFAYDAMLSAGRALVFSYGLRPRSQGSHKIVVDFSERVLGGQCKVAVRKFDKMRRKRHYLIYGIESDVSKTEGENAIKTAQDFVEKITKIVQQKSPQKGLWQD